MPLKTQTNIHIQKKAMITALENSLGVVTVAAKEVGISRQQHYIWLKNDSDYKTAVDDIQNISLDFVETKLFKQVDKGDTACIIFYLKTKGKVRGYGQDESGDKEQKIKIVLDENNVGMREELERVQQRNKVSSE